MQEVIQKVIAVETEAKQLVQAARTRAEELLASSRAQARQIVDDARREAKIETETILAAAETEAEKEKSERLSRVAKEIEAAIHLDEATVQQLVAAALDGICGCPHAAKGGR